MRWSDIPFKPPTATLRQFGAVGAVVLAGLAGRQYFVQADAVSAVLLMGLACTAGAAAIFFPSVLRPVFVGWMVLTYPISWATSHLILAFLFYCIFTPVGLFFKLIGRDALGLRTRGDEKTYWAAKSGAENIRSYFRQF